MRYWGYRINTDQIGFFRAELEEGRLRQGWGFDPGQNLRDTKVDAGAELNRRMYNEVKKGHILLVPSLPMRPEVAIVRATEDWDKGYRFEIHAKQGDYGHIFPAKFLRSFSRGNEHVSGGVASTLRYLGRFWNIDRLGEDVEALLRKPKGELTTVASDSQRFENAIARTLSEAFDGIGDDRVYEALNHAFQGAQWENVLVDVFKARFPGCEVTREGGRTEAEHGTDILIRVPGVVPEAPGYGIAVQVKDHEGVVDSGVLGQIAKAERWDEDPHLTLVDKVVLVTKANKKDNAELVEDGKKAGVSVVFADDLKALLRAYLMCRVGLGEQ